MQRLPDEILFQIILECQPHYHLETSELFLRPHSPRTQVWINNNTKERLVLSSIKQENTLPIFNSNGYHQTLACSYKKVPILVIISQISYRFRQLAFSHPLYSSLNWHYLLKRPVISKGPAHYSKFLQNFDYIPSLSCKTILLDLDIFGLNIYVKDVKNICKTVKRPENVNALVLSFGWSSLGDYSLLAFLGKTFPNVKQVFLKGEPSDSVLYGFDNKSLKVMAKYFKNLTHLHLEGYGGSSFNFKYLCFLLKANPLISHLSLGYVCNGINLGN